jgi:hypothetical protein
VDLALAQEKKVLDSISNIPIESLINQLNLIKTSAFDNSFSPEGLNLFEPFRLNQPILPNFNKNLGFSGHLNTSQVFSESNLNTGFGFSPFFSTGKIFNQATYRLNDRFLLGGNSFGAQSVFDPPRINSSIQNMNWKGASLFLQYKASKNVKVEGRVSISNRPNPWEP